MTDLGPVIARLGTRPAAAPVSAQERDKISILPTLFLISLVIPIQIPVGPLLLMPHRIFLILVFFPLFAELLGGKVGRLIWADYALLFSAIWATISLLISEGTGVAAGADPIQAIGIYWVEFWGAYLVGRVCIRSASGFVRFVWVYFILIMILLPFAAIESFTHKPLFLDLIPHSFPPTYTDWRWGMRRAQTAFEHPILFGVFVSSAFGLFWYIFTSTFTRITGILTSVASTVFSLSTGAYISIIMQSFFIFWELATKRVFWRWRAFIGLSILAYIVIDAISNRTPFHVLVSYAAFNTDSAYTRILIWDFGIENVAKRPWFGLGLNVINWDRPYWLSPSADNFWLLTAMQYGIPAAASLLAALTMIIRGASKVTLTDQMAKRCQAGFLTTMGGIIIAGGTVHYWHQMLAFVMFFFGAGVWIFTTDAKSSPKKEAEETPEWAHPPKYTRFSPLREGSGTGFSDHRPTPPR